MAQCLQLVSLGGGVTALTLDQATPPSSCSLLAINGSEYATLSRGVIDSADDAQLIVGAFLVLFAVVAGFKAISRALAVGDVSDEKH